jgi:hypothetical protein
MGDYFKEIVLVALLAIAVLGWWMMRRANT